MTAAFKYKKTDGKSLFSLGQTGPGVMALNYKESQSRLQVKIPYGKQK